MTKEELNSERIPFRDIARQIHTANKAGKRYTAEVDVTVLTRTPRRIGPWALPSMFDIRHWSTTNRKIFTLDPPDGTVIMLDDGTIALRNPKTGMYESFDFRTSNSDDFDIVRRVLRKWQGIIPTIRTVAEQSDRLKANPPRNDHNPPH
jgi:hypothetical protein